MLQPQTSGGVEKSRRLGMKAEGNTEGEARRRGWGLAAARVCHGQR